MLLKRKSCGHSLNVETAVGESRFGMVSGSDSLFAALATAATSFGLSDMDSAQ